MVTWLFTDNLKGRQTLPKFPTANVYFSIRINMAEFGMLNLGIKLTELGIIPESVLRIFIRKLIRQRLLEIPIDTEERESIKADFIEELKSSPIALSTRQANEQHYEVPPAFFSGNYGVSSEIFLWLFR